MTTALLIAALLLLGLALHPFATYPLSLWLLARRDRPLPPAPAALPPDEPGRPRLSILMCAYNEAAVLGAKLHHLRELQAAHPPGAVEILVYIDAATDASAAIARRHAHAIGLHVATERHGKTHGMNLLARHARAPILVFTDANVMLAPDALDALERRFRDPAVGCVCADLSYTNAVDSVTAGSGALYWRIEQRIKRLEQRFGSMMGADGSLFAVRRCLHRPPPDHIIDDMYVSLSILCDGWRVIQADDVHAYEASVSASDEEFRRKVRIACQAFNVHRLLWPRLRRLPALTRYQYVSHKLLRWFTIYLLALSALAFEAALLAAGWPGLALALPVIAGGLLWLGHRHGVRPVAQVADILLAFAGTGLGVWRSLRGDRFQTWAPAASIRKA
ncbi:MAG TPA: glycosyltransferase [Methylibium sp.]|nr:glycosyltransferase [Methylibium sp.]